MLGLCLMQSYKYVFLILESFSHLIVKNTVSEWCLPGAGVGGNSELLFNG